MKFIALPFVTVICAVLLAPGAQARETQTQKDNRAYFQCLSDTLMQQIEALGHSSGENMRSGIAELGERTNPVYAQCQAMPGSNDLTFNGIYCANISKLDTMIRLHGEPDVFAFYMFADENPRSTDHLWFETSNCLMAAPATALHDINSFAAHCTPQIQKNIAVLKPLAAQRGLGNAELGKVLNAEVKTFYNTRRCMMNGGTFD